MVDLPSQSLIIYILDMIGVFSCTVAATMLAKRLKFDISGALVVSFAGAVGGGSIRDVLLNRHPVFWLHDLGYFYLIVATSLVVQVFYYQFEKLGRVIRVFDALGLAAFTVIGLEAALGKQMAWPIAVTMGIMTAAAGGVLRDVICRQLPLVLHKEIYMTAALIGGVFYYVLYQVGASLWVRDVATLLVIFVLRMLAVYKKWDLPDLTWQPKGLRENEDPYAD